MIDGKIVFEKSKNTDGVIIQFVKEDSNILVVPDKVYYLGNEMEVTEIKDFAFRSGNFEEADIADSVEIIGEWAFQYCEKLKSIKLPNSLKVIESHLFLNCESLERIVIPDSVTEIKDNAFYDCKNLKEIVLPKSLKVIGKDAFYNCVSLE
ncbi:MAG: leucine-rich repeat domain-containing protein, partial [Clostridia bacterium]|nr:leucine-rich repeat domain-containing protein [Clostridia bacterium]